MIAALLWRYETEECNNNRKYIFRDYKNEFPILKQGKAQFKFYLKQYMVRKWEELNLYQVWDFVCYIS